MEVPELVKTAKVEETKVLDAEPVAVKPVAEVAPIWVSSISVRPLKLKNPDQQKPTSKPKGKGKGKPILAVPFLHFMNCRETIQ